MSKRERIKKLNAYKREAVKAAIDLYGDSVADEIRQCTSIGDAERILIRERNKL